MFREVFLGVIECIFVLLILHFAKMNIFFRLNDQQKVYYDIFFTDGNKYHVMLQ